MRGVLTVLADWANQTAGARRYHGANVEPAGGASQPPSIVQHDSICPEESRLAISLAAAYTRAMNLEPGTGGSSGGPAKHCARLIHIFAGSPLTVKAVSAIFRTCVTT